MSETRRGAGLFPALLKHWRRQRGLSQLDLALTADVSARHISFLETGRSRPSPEMVLTVASALGVPLRQTNEMLRAAGHPPAFEDSGDELPSVVESAVSLLLEHHEPYPLFVLDRTYHVLHANGGAARLLDAVLGPDRTADAALNLARLTFDPDGAQPFLVNFADVGRELLWRIHREVLADDSDAGLRDLLDELLSMPTVDPDWRQADLSGSSDPALVVHLRRDGVDLRFLTAVTSFAGPHNLAVEHLRIETWFPVDDETAEICASAALGYLPTSG
jgi:transcriptional regulator with XRE-family HTH domain